LRRPLLFALLALCAASLLVLPGLGSASVPRKHAVYKGKTEAGKAITLKTYRHGTRLGYSVRNTSTCTSELTGSDQNTVSKDGGKAARRAKINRRTGKFKLHYQTDPSFQDTVDIYIKGRVTRKGVKGTFRRHLHRNSYESVQSDCDTGVLSFKARRK
jgi:hypothetical protein